MAQRDDKKISDIVLNGTKHSVLQGDAKIIANAFVSYFGNTSCSNFHIDQYEYNLPEGSIASSFAFLPVGVQEVVNIINKLPSSHSCGIDGITAQMVKNNVDC